MIIILILSGCTSNHNIITEYIPPPIIKKVDVALVLGGGGSKGIAHIGAIEVLIENNIPINLIVGSSAGSAVGALFSDSKDIAKTKEILFKAKAKKLLDFIEELMELWLFMILQIERVLRMLKLGCRKLISTILNNVKF